MRDFVVIVVIALLFGSFICSDIGIAANQGSNIHRYNGTVTMDAHKAAEITNVPSGSVTGTTVQAAIDELAAGASASENFTGRARGSIIDRTPVVYWDYQGSITSGNVHYPPRVLYQTTGVSSSALTSPVAFYGARSVKNGQYTVSVLSSNPSGSGSLRTVSSTTQAESLDSTIASLETLNSAHLDICGIASDRFLVAAAAPTYVVVYGATYSGGMTTADEVNALTISGLSDITKARMVYSNADEAVLAVAHASGTTLFKLSCAATTPSVTGQVVLVGASDPEMAYMYPSASLLAYTTGGSVSVCVVTSNTSTPVANTALTAQASTSTYTVSFEGLPVLWYADSGGLMHAKIYVQPSGMTIATPENHALYVKPTSGDVSASGLSLCCPMSETARIVRLSLISSNIGYVSYIGTASNCLLPQMTDTQTVCGQRLSQGYTLYYMRTDSDRLDRTQYAGMVQTGKNHGEIISVLGNGSVITGFSGLIEGMNYYTTSISTFAPFGQFFKIGKATSTSEITVNTR